jgi:hypothetical protein
MKENSIYAGDEVVKQKLHLKIPYIAPSTIYRYPISINLTTYFYFITGIHGCFFNLATDEEISLSCYIILVESPLSKKLGTRSISDLFLDIRDR